MFMDSLLDIHGLKIGRRFEIHGSKIYRLSLDININTPKIGAGFDIRGPKIDDPTLDIHEPKIGLPNSNININASKIGGRLVRYSW